MKTALVTGISGQDGAYLSKLKAIRFTGKGIRLYNACSSVCFGDLKDGAATKESPFRPRSPYAVAKAAAFWQASNYREAYNIFACSGIDKAFFRAKQNTQTDPPRKSRVSRGQPRRTAK